MQVGYQERILRINVFSSLLNIFILRKNVFFMFLPLEILFATELIT